MKGKIVTRRAGTVCSIAVALLLLAGSVTAGEMAPIPGPQPHSKRTKPVKNSQASNPTSSTGSLTWFEMAEIMLSNLGLL